jgi:hypothetical protein
MRVGGAVLRASRRTSPAPQLATRRSVAIPIGEPADSTFVLPAAGSASMIRPRCPVELAAAGRQFTISTDGWTASPWSPSRRSAWRVPGRADRSYGCGIAGQGGFPPWPP